MNTKLFHLYWLQAVFIQKLRWKKRDGEKLSLIGDAAGGMESWSSPRKAQKFQQMEPNVGLEPTILLRLS